MSGEPVVCNAGPLMVLAKLHLLHLLHTLYSRVHIPRSVYEETVTEGLRQGYEDARTLRDFLNQMGWQPENIPPSAVPADLQVASLDSGERDTLTLALMLDNACVLMDENMGRIAARSLGLAVRGSISVLVDAYRHNLMDADALRLYLAEIIRRQDIWISRALVERVLRDLLGDEL